MAARGSTERGSQLERGARAVNYKLPDNLSYQQATVFDAEHGYNIDLRHVSAFGQQKNLAVINSDRLNEKTVVLMPGDTIQAGDLIVWMGNHWLVTEKDANTTLYTRAKVIQCNHLLKWVSDDMTVCEQWCIIEDGTKYLTGEYEDRGFVVTRGDSRIAMTIARNGMTVKLSRSSRFIIDDAESSNPTAYQLTKPFKLGGSYNGVGVFKFVLQESITTEDDNIDMGIADYYKHFPKYTTVDAGDATVINDGNVQGDTGRRVWL